MESKEGAHMEGGSEQDALLQLEANDDILDLVPVQAVGVQRHRRRVDGAPVPEFAAP
jgi:hypothetical protein